MNNQSSNLVHSVEYYYSRYWAEYGDPRLNKSTLLGGGPWQMLIITLTYLTAVTLFGPYVMRKRKPMEILWPIRVYNAFMVAFNAYLFINFSLKLRWGLDCWGCGKAMQRVDQTLLLLYELTLLSRYFDFCDSIFFVCRKKFDHLSLLHVTHHTSVPIIVWFATKFEPTPMIVFAAYINLPIHVIMYTYYGLSTFPKLKQYLWWKKYITSIQIIQFCIDLAHSLQTVFYPYCKYHTMTYIQFAFSLTFLYLFTSFYSTSYTAAAAASKIASKNHSEQQSTSSSSSSIINGNNKLTPNTKIKAQ